MQSLKGYKANIGVFAMAPADWSVVFRPNPSSWGTPQKVVQDGDCVVGAGKKPSNFDKE